MGYVLFTSSAEEYAAGGRKRHIGTAMTGPLCKNRHAGLKIDLGVTVDEDYVNQEREKETLCRKCLDRYSRTKTPQKTRASEL